MTVILDAFKASTTLSSWNLRNPASAEKFITDRASGGTSSEVAESSSLTCTQKRSLSCTVAYKVVRIRPDQSGSSHKNGRC